MMPLLLFLAFSWSSLTLQSSAFAPLTLIKYRCQPLLCRSWWNVKETHSFQRQSLWLLHSNNNNNNNNNDDSGQQSPRSPSLPLMDGQDENEVEDDEAIERQQRMELERVFKKQRFDRASDDGSSSSTEGQGPVVQEDVHLPSTGISVDEVLDAAKQDQFTTTFLPLKAMMKGGPSMEDSVAHIVTETTNSASLEPLRYLIALLAPSSGLEDDTSTTRPFAMVDVPPYSRRLEQQIRSYLDHNNGTLQMLLMTSRDMIHCDEAPGVVYSAQSPTHLRAWCEAFPDMAVIGYRMDIPRRAREYFTQILDGYGPWGLKVDNDDHTTPSSEKVSFREMGRPLTYSNWEEDESINSVTSSRGGYMPGQINQQDLMRKELLNVMNRAETEEEGEKIEASAGQADDTKLDTTSSNEEDLYSPAAIRAREEGQQLLAVYTPGHTFGSITYVFPHVGVVASGRTLPIEEDIAGSTGPSLDIRGYISTGRAGLVKQMESARMFVEGYVDRFHTILPSSAGIDPVFLYGSPMRNGPVVADDPAAMAKKNQQRNKKVLLDLIDHYEQIGILYDQLRAGCDGDQEEDDAAGRASGVRP